MAPANFSRPSAAQLSIVWPLAVALPILLSITRKPFRSSLRSLSAPRRKSNRPAAAMRPPAPSSPEASLRSTPVWLNTMCNRTFCSLRPLPPSSKTPPSSDPRPVTCSSAKLPPTAAEMSARPLSDRSPPINKSQSGCTSPEASNWPAIGLVRSIARLNGRTDVTVGKLNWPLAFKPCGVPAEPEIFRSPPPRVAFI